MSNEDTSLDWVRKLANTLHEHKLHKLSFETEDVSVTLRARTAKPIEVAQVVEHPSVEDVEEADVELITSENVGIFRSTVDLEPGTEVSKGQKLGTVESVSLHHDLISDRSGTLLEVLARDGDPVEYGQPLLVLSAEGSKVNV